MRRCPECDFLYEDDQVLCDMDGTKLIHDGRELPGNGPLGLLSQRRWPRKHLPVVVIFSAFLGALLFMPMPRQRLPPPGAASPDKETNMATASVSQVPQRSATSRASFNAPLNTARWKATSSVKKHSTRQSGRREEGRLAKVSTRPLVQKTGQPNNSIAHSRVLRRTDNLKKQKVSKTGEAEVSNDRKDSRIASILRKTGRILQRPFKL